MRGFIKSKFFRVIVIVVVAMIVGLLLIERNVFSTSDSLSAGALQKRLTGESLNCTILIDKKLNPAQPGLRFATTLIRKFSEQHHCTVNISVERNSKQEWDDLLTTASNMIIFNLRDSIPKNYADYIEHSVVIEDDYVCAVKLGNDILLENINYWISHFKQTSEYEKLWSAAKKSASRSRYGFGLTRYTISQYDDLVKKHSRTIDWDWRLLSALIYQESKFNKGVVSPRGAIGLMQVMESTAERHGVSDVYNPEFNILAGVRELSRLQRRYKKMGADSLNTIILTLAAYNCGEGKIQQCMKVAQSKGKDSLIWENLTENVSRETSIHVENILRQYDLYSRTVVE